MLVSALVAHGEHVNVLRDAVSLLSNAIIDEPTRTSFVNAGGISALVSMISSITAQPDLAITFEFYQSCWDLVGNVASRIKQHKSALAMTIPVILATMRPSPLYVSPHSLIESASFALRNLTSRHAANCADVIARGGVSLLVLALQERSRSADAPYVFEHICGALANLGRNDADSCAAAMAAAGGGQLLMTHLVKYRSDRKRADAVCSALAYVAPGQPTAAADFSRVLAVVSNSPTSDTLRRHALRLLFSFAKKDTVKGLDLLLTGLAARPDGVVAVAAVIVTTLRKLLSLAGAFTVDQRAMVLVALARWEGPEEVEGEAAVTGATAMAALTLVAPASPAPAAAGADEP